MSESERRRDAGMIHQVSEMLGRISERVDIHSEKLESICQKIDKIFVSREEFHKDLRDHMHREEKALEDLKGVKSTAETALELAKSLDDTRKRVKYGIIGAASAGTIGGTGLSGLLAWLKGWL